MQNTIQVKDLQKSYKNLHVLKGVIFEVEKGSIFALLGSNGAGKTILLCRNYAGGLFLCNAGV